MNKAYDKVTWQNTPSTASPLNATNLNKMSDALDTIDDRVITLDGQASSASSAITALQEGKVDKVEGYGLSENDYTTTEKTKLAGISAQANKVEITPVVTEGTTLATISIDGVDTAIKGSDIDVDDELDLTSENPVQNKVVTGALNNKLDTDGVAEGANMLTINTPVSDDTPYVYREIPVKNAFRENLKKIIGASVVWNQLIADNTSLSFTTSDTSAKKASDVSFIANHIYLMSYNQNVTLASNTRNTAFFNDGNTGYQVPSANANLSSGIYQWIFKPTTTTANGQVGIWCNSPSANVTYNKFMLTDLTAMFGSTIADYVKTLETAEAGSGILWLQKYGFFTEEYYAYSANTIQSVSVSGHKVVGTNQWDEQWESGGYNSSGEKVVWSGAIRSKNVISVSPNTAYYCKYSIATSFYVCWYTDSSFIERVSINTSGVVTSPSNATKMTFCTQNNYGDTYNNNISINYPSTDTEYHAYTEETTALDHTTLRGIFTLDANNNLYADGDIYNADGSGSVKYAEVDLGSLDWSKGSGYFYTHSLNTVVKLNTANILCPLFISDTTGNRMQIDGNGTLIVVDDRYTDMTKEQFKTAMSGVYLVYELATPTTASLTPFNPISVIENGGTEEFIDYGVEQGNRDVAIPVATETEYTQAVEITSLPADDGTYTMKLVKSASGSTINFVADT